MKSITTTTRVREREKEREKERARARERKRERERERIENQGEVAMGGKKKFGLRPQIFCGGLSGTQTRESAFASFCARDTSIFYFFLFSLLCILFSLKPRHI